jgi:hypothetical protein
MAYEIKTKVNDNNVKSFLNSVEDPKRKEDSLKIYQFINKLTNWKPKMYGDNIVGYGNYSYLTKSGCKGDWFNIGFSPRKNYLAIYIVPYLDESEELLKKIGKAKCGKSCINVTKLENIDLKILEKLIKLSIKKSIKSNA